MSIKENFDVDVYRTELECMDDDELFGESELTDLTDKQMNALVEKHEEELDTKDMSELYGDEEWERLRASKVEERINARLEAPATDS